MTKRGVVLGILFLLALAPPAMATHVPSSSEVISYAGSLQPGVASTGTMGWGSTPPKGYTWYCFDVTSGKAVTLNVKKTSGDLKPNLGVMRGLAEAGGTATLPIVKDTSNPDQDQTSLTFTPDFTGPVTLWVSTFLGEKNGVFSVTMTGGTGRSSCGAVDAGPSGPLLAIVPDAPSFVMGNSQTIKVPVQVFAASTVTSDIAINAGVSRMTFTCRSRRAFSPRVAMAKRRSPSPPRPIRFLRPTSSTSSPPAASRRRPTVLFSRSFAIRPSSLAPTSQRTPRSLSAARPRFP